MIAIDFGTTGTGFAFQSRADFLSDQLKMYENLLDEGEALHYKTPTCLLVNPNKTQIYFGEAAEDLHARLEPEDNPEEWFFFRNFKMQLYGKEVTFNRNIYAINVIKYDIGIHI